MIFSSVSSKLSRSASSRPLPPVLCEVLCNSSIYRFCALSGKQGAAILDFSGLSITATMLRLLRTIFCIVCLLLFLALAIAWPLARSKPIGIWLKSTKSDLFGEYIHSSNYYFITIENNHLQIGQWRDPKLAYDVKQSYSMWQGPLPIYYAGRAIYQRTILPRPMPGYPAPIHMN